MGLDVWRLSCIWWNGKVRFGRLGLVKSLGLVWWNVRIGFAGEESLAQGQVLPPARILTNIYDSNSAQFTIIKNLLSFTIQINNWIILRAVSHLLFCICQSPPSLAPTAPAAHQPRIAFYQTKFFLNIAIQVQVSKE